MVWSQMMLVGTGFGALALFALLQAAKVKTGRLTLPLLAITCFGLAVVIGISNDWS